SLIGGLEMRFERQLQFVDAVADMDSRKVLLELDGFQAAGRWGQFDLCEQTEVLVDGRPDGFLPFWEGLKQAHDLILAMLLNMLTKVSDGSLTDALLQGRFHVAGLGQGLYDFLFVSFLA